MRTPNAFLFPEFRLARATRTRIKTAALVIVCASIALLGSTPAFADQIFTTSFTTDGGLAVTATADFSVINSTEIQVVLTNTTPGSFEDGTNLSAFSFQLNNYGSGTYLGGSLASISGNTICATTTVCPNGIPLNTNVSGLITTGGASLTNTPWTSTAPMGNSIPTANTITEFAALGGSPGNLSVKGSIVGPANSNNEYVAGTCSGGPPMNPCGSQTAFGANSGDDPTIYGSATFVYNLTGGTVSALEGLAACLSSGQTCISNVTFGVGPDGPDADDIGYGTLCTSCGGSTVPEPSTDALLGAGLLGIGCYRFRRKPAGRAS